MHENRLIIDDDVFILQNNYLTQAEKIPNFKFNCFCIMDSHHIICGHNSYSLIHVLQFDGSTYKSIINREEIRAFGKSQKNQGVQKIK